MSQASAGGYSDVSQDARLISLETPLGEDRFILTSVSGEEAISELFRFDLELLSLDHAIRPEDIVGYDVTLWIRNNDGQKRPVRGVVSRFSAGGMNIRGMRLYRARVVPWLWLLTQTSDCRIFQDLNVPGIVQRVLKEYGFADFEMSLSSEDYPKLEFCVQYRETTFDFLSRLMEEVGIFYFFRHEAGRHVMVVADKNNSFRPLEQDAVDFSEDGHAGQISAWDHFYALHPGRWAQNDFNFLSPATDLKAEAPSTIPVAHAQELERYDYPGRYSDLNYGRMLTLRRVEAEEATYHTAFGASSHMGLFPGARFKLGANFPAGETSQAFVVRRVRHEAREGSYFAGDNARTSYTNTFEAFLASVVFRPPRATPRPVVQGPQTATVVGPKGEEIHTDEHGRVRVRFHWDRYAKGDDRDSCWVRVSQNSAGKGWGGMFMPHVGHEVVVSFLEGDPDRPLITGRVYNGKNGNSVGMPANKTQSAIRDHSGNEVVLEGKKGSEDIRIHAVKDMHTLVDNNADLHVKVKLTETVDGGQEVTVSKGYKETITDGATSTITGGLKSTVNGPWEDTINGKLTEKITGGEDRTVSSGRKVTVDGGLTETVTGKHETTVTGEIKQSSTATTDIHSTGAATFTSDASIKIAVAGSVIEITPMAITISSGPSTVKLDMSGVSVSGPKISLNG
ncbi:type VI secretion system Vgr family protein [Pararoseomonas indoligenes]|uniref:Type VI secretion system tip protein VgrG n=1 Tax=Roseomonas indoligenes TaxID=2820811 RepID=A0A940MPV7_9PROT|nr:type VI secretion system tip protein TssI/VgrG [Pararoseomonas indoligenes]MBP0491793.1 type VI secretion system tip protein VgrG [Pararoseomonas indoligenes]